MVQNNVNVVQTIPMPAPKVGSCYANGWRQLWKYILELLLITVIGIMISLPLAWSNEVREAGGAGAAFLGIFALAYGILLTNPIDYGISFAHLRAARGDRLEVKDMFGAFQNYLNAVLANLLVGIIVCIGLVLLIVPGIIFACKLAFVPYLVVDRKMEAVEAVKESWRMTGGHSWRVFIIGLLAIPIAIAGLICLGVGIIVSIMWIRLAFASLYHAVSVSGEASD